MPDKTDRTVPIWEQHGQTIIAALILAGILWVGSAVTSLNSTMGIVLTRIDGLEAKLAAMDRRFSEYQTRDQAASERETQRARDQILQLRIQRLEEEVKSDR